MVFPFLARGPPTNDRLGPIDRRVPAREAANSQKGLDTSSRSHRGKAREDEVAKGGETRPAEDEEQEEKENAPGT